MNINDILSKVDHTLLSPNATWDEIRAVCDDGIKYGTASVCIPASYVKAAKEYVGDGLAICTVIGFPCGYSTSEVKCFEAE
ncbi:MAG: 2-deoxyribose-5-phosphate aldolase, partial [Clostridia bacterium]|nr:2-deoxyribose-5-phosphate aldolase [Clostridia bacterium]